jgi:hypothetical protein
VIKRHGIKPSKFGHDKKEVPFHTHAQKKHEQQQNIKFSNKYFFYIYIYVLSLAIKVKTLLIVLKNQCFVLPCSLTQQKNQMMDLYCNK